MCKKYASDTNIDIDTVINFRNWVFHQTPIERFSAVPEPIQSLFQEERKSIREKQEKRKRENIKQDQKKKNASRA